MKKMISVLSMLVFSHSSFALSSLHCKAQMEGRSVNSPKGFIAPILTGQGLNSILKAQHQTNHLVFILNPQTVTNTKAHVILDGRTKHIPLNTHLSFEEVNNILSISLRDTETQKTDTKEFDINSEINFHFDNGSATFRMNCWSTY